MSFISCSKSNSTPTPPPQPPIEQEANIAFGVDPDPGVGIAAAQSSNYSFKVSLSSKMPSNGIKIDITTKRDADGTVIESKSFESSSTSNDISVGSLSMGVLYEISVVVTSKKTISNSAVKKFRVARKS